MSDTQKFAIHPITRFPSNAPIRRPRELTYFSYDDEHQYCQDDSQLRYYYPPFLPSDLNGGYSDFRCYDDSRDEHLDGLLRSIIHHERTTQTCTPADFITWRGMLTKILITPYTPNDGWEMNATRFQDTVFIEQNHVAKLEDRARQDQRVAFPGAMSQDLMSYWGYKFETLSVLPNHWCHSTRAQIESRESEQVSNYAQYCSIVRTGFGRSKVVIGGEVDAVIRPRSDNPKEQTEWVELKTSAELVNEKEVNKFEKKLLKFWAQSFLLGVPKIIVGFRDAQGMLRRLEEIDVQEIPERVARNGRGMWDGQRCIDFASAFLEWLGEVVVGEGLWRISKAPRSGEITVKKVDESGTGGILSKEFLEWRMTGLEPHHDKPP